MAHQAGAYPGFKEYFYSPLDGMLVHRRVTPSIKFAGTYLYTWVKRGTVRVKCLAQRGTVRVKCLAQKTPKSTTQCPRPGLEPRALAPESSALTMRPPRLFNRKSNNVVLPGKHSVTFQTVLRPRPFNSTPGE